MADVYEEIKDFRLGVIASSEGDSIPNNALTLAYNTAFRAVGPAGPSLGTRPGLVTVNDSAISGTPVIHRLWPYAYNNAGTYVNYLALFNNNGTLYYKQENDTLSSALAPPANYPFSSGTAFTTGDYVPDVTVMNNRLFAVNTNGERRSLLGTSYVPFGLSPIATVAVTAQTGGSASMPLEAYDVAVTSYNSSTGSESSASASASVTTAGANDRIRVVITPTSAETAQYTHWRIYLRRQSTQTRLYKVTAVEDSGGSAIAGAGDIAIATTTAYIDLTAAQIAALITAAPSTTENNPPTVNCRFLAVYGRRLIAADRSSVFYSKLDLPDNFPPENEEPIDTGEGDQITGIHVFSDELLLVFTTSATLGIFGNDPQTWTVRPIDMTIGCASLRSIAPFNKGVGWWSDRVGPVFFDGMRVSKIGFDNLGADVVIDDVQQTKLSLINAGVDPSDGHVLWYYPETGVTDRCTRGIPWNYQLNAWEASRWDPIDIASQAIGYNTSGVQRLFVGGHEGQLFYFNRDVKNDGIVGGTTTGTFTATSSSMSNFTGSGFYNSNGKLTDRRFTVVDAMGRPKGRYRISSNDGTTITPSSNIVGLNAGSVYTYYIGGPDVRIYTKWIDFEQPFLRKRFDRLYVQARSDSGTPIPYVSTQISFTDSFDATPATLEIPGDIWDSGVWDVAQWAGSSVLKRRVGLWRNATACRIAMFHYKANVDLVLTKFGLLARTLSDRYLV